MAGGFLLDFGEKEEERGAYRRRLPESCPWSLSRILLPTWSAAFLFLWFGEFLGILAVKLSSATGKAAASR